MKAKKVQKGNPRGLTVLQHVFPVRSLRRFTNPTGLLCVLRKGVSGELHLQPENPMFCARRAWDQRTETGLMKTIEDKFQVVAEQIMSGRNSLQQAQHSTVTAFYAIWRLRAELRARPIADQRAVGLIQPSTLTEDQQEILEMNGYSFVDATGAFPGRMLAAIHIQRGIAHYQEQLRDHRWGIVRATGAEFVVPDQFGTSAVVPVAPKTCLVSSYDDTTVSEERVKELNNLAIQASGKYLVARSFAACFN